MKLKMNWNSNLYDNKHAFVYEYGKGLAELLNPQPGEKILDLGCGTGVLTAHIAESGAQVTGIDSSPEMISKAKILFPEVNFEVMDASELRMKDTFDAIFSNAVLHWIPEKERVIKNMYASLKPNGRIVVEFGGKDNVKGLISAMKEAALELTGKTLKTDFWYYPSLGEYTTLLENEGFRVLLARHYDRPTELSGTNGIADWFRMFGELIFKDVTEEEKENILQLTQDKLSRSHFKNGKWYADYKRLSIMAVKEAE